MEEIVFVTHNKGKAKSAERYFNNLKFTTYDFELDEPRSDDIKEIVTAKVKQAYEIVKKPCIALDTGFFIDELNGFPRAFVNFSLDTIGIDGILKLMQGKENRKCRFEECLAYHDGKEIYYFYGKHPGNLATKIQGRDREEKWSDLWYIFKPEHFEKTLAEMDTVEREERRKIDGSVEALKVFAEWYKENNMLKNIEINCHSSIKITKEKTIYIDPFKIEKESNDADIILITHDHYDHYSPEDLKKVVTNKTIIVAPKTVKVLSKMKNVILVEPSNTYKVEGIKIETIPSYNTNKQFHPKENQWVGYIIEIDGTRYYIPGDTDITPENKQVKCDVAFIPVGGTYTMNYEEAAELANIIKPKIVVPTHYGSIVGTKEDGIEFKKLINPEIECMILIK